MLTSEQQIQALIKASEIAERFIALGESKGWRRFGHNVALVTEENLVQLLYKAMEYGAKIKE